MKALLQRLASALHLPADATAEEIAEERRQLDELLIRP